MEGTSVNFDNPQPPVPKDLLSWRVLVVNKDGRGCVEPKPVVVTADGKIYPGVVMVDLIKGRITQSFIMGIHHQFDLNTPIRLWRESLWLKINTWPSNEDVRYAVSPYRYGI